MAFFRVYPRQRERYPSQNDIADAILTGLSQGMNDLDQFLGPYHRARSHRGPCGGASQRQGSNCSGTRGPKEQKQGSRKAHGRVPNSGDPVHAWLWWMLGGGDSSDSDEECQGPTTGRQQGTPRGRGRPCGLEESCAMKRKPSRSASNAPPYKKKEETKSDEEETPKFNFTGMKTSEKNKSEKKETKKPEKKSEAEMVLVKPAPWRHVVTVSDDFGPEDVRVYVRDGRIHVEGRRERNVGGNDDVVECLEVNRELVVPSDVVLDDLSVFYRSGGRLELEASRRVQGQKTQTELVKDLEKMSVEDIEIDAVKTLEAEIQKSDAESHEKEAEDEDLKKPSDEVGEEKEEQAEDWEMLPEDKTEDNESIVANDNEDEAKESENVKEKLEEAAEDEIQPENKEQDVKISETEEITTKPIVEEPAETDNTNNDITIETEEQQPSNLVIRIVSEDQQQTQIEESSQLLGMNLAGFEPRDVRVSLDGDRVSVRAVRETDEEGFVSRKESYRSFRVPDHVKTSELAVTMGPEAKLVITSPSA